MKRYLLTLLIAALWMLPQALDARTITGDGVVGLKKHNTFPRTGTVRIPVVIVEFTDIKLQGGHAQALRHFDAKFNSRGYDYNNATGSVRDYFTDASKGRFSPVFDLLGVVPLSHDHSYYGAGPVGKERSGEMVVEALNKLASRVDWGKYDSNHDGKIDDVIVIFAGIGEGHGNDEDLVHACSMMLRYHGKTPDITPQGLPLGNVFADCCIVAFERLPDKYGGIGTIVHELSHSLGLPDSYNLADTKATYTPRRYDVMDVGCHNNSGNTPPTYAGYQRYAMSWTDAEVIEPGMTLTLGDLVPSNKVYILPVTQNEYFIIEYRAKKGWDKYLPESGLIVWHIDFDADEWYYNRANKYPDHQRIAMELVTGDTYTFPTPYAGKKTNLMLTDITIADGKVTAKVRKAGSGSSLHKFIKRMFHK